MTAMKLPLYQVDAFTGRMFSGNPAAVVLLDDWLSDDILSQSLDGRTPAVMKVQQ